MSIENKIYYCTGYKYQLKKTFQMQINIYPKNDIKTEYILLNKSGLLTIVKGYCWDGASGAKDTNTIMKGPLVHDALYQLLRNKRLHEKYRETADNILQMICEHDGMNEFRSWYVHLAVDKFGYSAANPDNKKKILTAP